MTDPRILDALDIPRDADAAEVGRCFRRMMELTPVDSPDSTLWLRFLDKIEEALTFPGGESGDGAQLANRVVMGAVAPPRRSR